MLGLQRLDPPPPKTPGLEPLPAPAPKPRSWGLADVPLKGMFVALCILSLTALPVQQAIAHGGGLDQNRCHMEVATGTRHCHPKKDDDEDWETAGYVVGGLLIVWLVYEAVSDEGLFSVGPLQISPQFTEKGEAGFIAEYALSPSQHLGVRAMNNDHGENRAGAYWRLEF